MNALKMLGLTALLTLFAGAGRAQVIDHSHPAAGNDDLIANQSYSWGPIFLGGVCRMTDKGTSEAASIFSREKVNITRFRNAFEFQIISGGPGDTTDGEGNCADGLTFTIQNVGTDVLGNGGGELGYGGIPHSVAIKFDCVPNEGDPSVSSTGIFVNGAAPFGGEDVLRDGVSLRSQHPFRVEMEYDGEVLRVRLIDVKTNNFTAHNYRIKIADTIGSKTAYVGFTAATGAGSSAQDLHKWYFASDPLPDERRSRRIGRAANGMAVASAKGVMSAAWPMSAPRTTPTAAARLKGAITVVRNK